jgi:IS30 family transposase
VASAKLAICRTIFNNEVQNFVLNGPTHIFVVRDLMADWGWGFTCPQPIPNPLLSRAKCNFQLANANKLIRQYIPKGTDFSTISSALIRKIQYKINRRPRKKLNFDCPKNVFFRQIANFALAS